MLNPNDDGGVDDLIQGGHYGQSRVAVIPEGFTVKLITDVRQRLLVALSSPSTSRPIIRALAPRRR